MQVILEVTEGPSSGEQIIVAPGQTIQIGRTDRADFSCPDDGEMSGIHFALTCEEAGCIVRDMESTNGTFVNGQRISATLIESGDLVKAGKSVFCVHFDAAGGDVADPSLSGTQSGSVVLPSPSRPSPPAPAPRTEGPLPTRTEFFKSTAVGGSTLEADSGFVADTAEEICQRSELDTKAVQHLQNGQSPREFVEQLINSQLLSDAIRFLAHALPKRAAVWWAQECVQLGAGPELSELDAAALEAARQWAVDPSEENRRAAHAAAESLEFGTPAAWPAMGAFWSNGSMAPAESPDVPVGETQAAKAIAGSVIMATVMHEPEHALDKQRAFVQRALSIGSGEKPW